MVLNASQLLLTHTFSRQLFTIYKNALELNKAQNSLDSQAL